jgi:hypothetical protein
MIGYGLNIANTYFFGFWANDYYSPAYTSDLNSWVFVTFTYNVSTRIRKFYRNGVYIGGDTASSQLTQSGTIIYIGRLAADGYATNGDCDDFRFYNGIELTPSQILELYNGRIDLYLSLGSVTSNINSLVLTQNSLVTFNNTTNSNINSGIYDIKFLNNSISFNSNIINDYSYPILNNINPIAWYKFDNSTSLGLDSSGNNYTLTNSGSITFSTTNYVKGYSSAIFNGTNYLYVPFSSGIFIPTAGFSMSLWAYIRRINQLQALVSTRPNDGTLRGYTLYFNDGTFGLQNGDGNTWYGGGSTPSAVITDTTFKWYHIVWISKYGTQQLYLNGVLVGSGTDNIYTVLPNNSGNFQVGTNIMGSYIVENGTCFDDLRFYSGTLLTQAQVLELYNGKVELFQQNISQLNVSITGTNNIIYTANDNINYRYASFINSGNFIINSNITCDIFIIGGGGGGGYNHGSGGGAGAYYYGTNIILNSGTYNINIGTGGSGGTSTVVPANGGDTFITYNGSSDLTFNGLNVRCKGGGAGGFWSSAVGVNGGCGGGADGWNGNSATNTTYAGGMAFNNGTIGFGYAGGTGRQNYNAGQLAAGGGGGIGGVGQNANGVEGGNGGDALVINITGSENVYGGGGGGSEWPAYGANPG